MVVLAVQVVVVKVRQLLRLELKTQLVAQQTQAAVVVVLTARVQTMAVQV
jgi:hypothetical protein